MRPRGGYNVLLKGRPGRAVRPLPEPGRLHLPLRSRRFTFSELRVEEGQRVEAGQALAVDPENHSVPLIAPRGGTVGLEKAEGHVTLEDLSAPPAKPYEPAEAMSHVPPGTGSAGMKRYRLMALGAWQFLRDAHTGELPDPFGTPCAVIVSTVDLEPYVARGDVQLHERLAEFVRGLEHVQSLLEYQPIHLVMPDVESEFAHRIRELLRGYAWVRVTLIPLLYGQDRFPVLCRRLGLQRNPDEPVWGLGVDGLMAMDRALTLSLPCDERVVSLGGPAVEEPGHYRAMPGYPLDDLLGGRLSAGPVRVVNGGVMNGAPLGEAQRGLDAECRGLTVLPDEAPRRFLEFMMPGWERRSYSRCFLSLLRRTFPEPLTTALRGEHRACISCGYCEEVCPVGIMPHLIHKYLYQDLLEEAEAAGLHLCAACGLCSFVCPSKIELRQEILEACERLQGELQMVEADL